MSLRNPVRLRNVAGRLVAVGAIAASLLGAGACGPTTATVNTATSTSRAPQTTPATDHPVPSTPAVVSHGPRTGNAVALTFDADMTVEMLAKLDNGQASSYANLGVIEVLERQAIPATFFLTGLWVQRYPDLTRRLADNPLFELANHTWSHRAYTPNCYNLPQVPRAEMASELRRTFDIIKPYGGNQTRYFRFPGLCYDAAALAAIAAVNVTIIQADVVSGDPHATAWEPIVHAVISTVTPGSIVVLHVTRDNAPMTDEALPPILEGLRAKGLRPVRLSQLLGQRG